MVQSVCKHGDSRDHISDIKIIIIIKLISTKGN